MSKEDPKKRAGDLKCPLHLLPTVAMREMAFALKLGAHKYGVYNWRESDGINAMDYVAAIMRHLIQFIDGEDADAESGRSHLGHILATCAILLDADQSGKLIDNRPPIVQPPITAGMAEFRRKAANKLCNDDYAGSAAGGN